MIHLEEEFRPSQFTFDVDPIVVERQIKGAIIISGKKRFIVIDAKGFPGADIKRKEFQEAKAQPIGTISGCSYRGKHTLPNITVAEQGLVMPLVVSEVKAGVNTKPIEGPSKIAKALGIEQNSKYQLAIEDPYSKVFLIKEFPQETT